MHEHAPVRLSVWRISLSYAASGGVIACLLMTSSLIDATLNETNEFSRAGPWWFIIGGGAMCGVILTWPVGIAIGGIARMGVGGRMLFFASMLISSVWGALLHLGFDVDDATMPFWIAVFAMAFLGACVFFVAVIQRLLPGREVEDAAG
ncbi:hypothetical protein [Ancylobacter terrae]|uniref:hypothetical protein n=1 Tax=Ancylobacter sp. sgz301288 TaxID=3342077 RepID=UPI00385D851B